MTKQELINEYSVVVRSEVEIPISDFTEFINATEFVDDDSEIDEELFKQFVLRSELMNDFKSHVNVYIKDNIGLVERFKRKMQDPEYAKHFYENAEEILRKCDVEKKVKERWLDKFHALDADKQNEILRKIKEKYGSDAYIDKWYSLGIFPPQPFNELVYEYSIKYGKKCRGGRKFGKNMGWKINTPEYGQGTASYNFYEINKNNGIQKV